VYLVDVILVIDQERVYNDFKTKLGDSVKCVHLPKSGGVSNRYSYFSIFGNFQVLAVDYCIYLLFSHRRFSNDLKINVATHE